jgi:pimeloyl-ACP methyl ester carboxylesterase
VQEQTTLRPQQAEEAIFMFSATDTLARTKLIHALVGAALFLTLALPPTSTCAQAAAPKPSIVLIHGAWADGSSWNSVIPSLLKAGYTVYAPPNPLRGLTSDAETIMTFLKSIPGPVILVGHSYGGAVASVASPNAPNVKALVYIDAFAPDEGESPLSLLAAYPAPPKDFFYAVPSASGGDTDVYIAPKYYGPVFASDVPAATASVQAITQRPLTNSALNEKAPAAEGWKTIPSWYVVGDADKVIPPALQMKMAERAKSHISHVNGSHPSMIEHPEATVAAILAADKATEEKTVAK